MRGTLHFILLFLLIMPNVSAQCAVPGDREPCDGSVNISELMDYINTWYDCSSCAPDLLAAIGAYYSPPCVNDPGCASAGSFCDGSTPYNCTYGGDGCLDRADGSVCGGGLACSAGRCMEAPGLTSNISLEPYGISWYFDKGYQYGTFANGDYWVVGPVNIINITPGDHNITKIGRSCSLGGKEYDPSCSGGQCRYTRVYPDNFYLPRVLGLYPPEYVNNGQACTPANILNCTDERGFYRNAGCSPSGNWIFFRALNGAMLNPSPLTNGQGYDNRMLGIGYDDNLNVADDVSQQHPLRIASGSSLVSAVSFDAPEQRPQLKTAAILTVLDSVPPEGSFRPGYTNISKEIFFNKNQLNYSVLKKLDPVTGTPALSTVERYFERPWIDHSPLWSAGYEHPSENMPNYGREISIQTGEGALMLNLNFADAEKEKLLIEYVQLGIDLYSIIRDGGKDNWIGMGGHASGRKFPILLAGMVLNDPEMKAIGGKSGDYIHSGGHGPGNPPEDYIHFGEDDQTHHVTDFDLGLNPHTPDSRDAVRMEYSPSDLGLPEWGIMHSTDPKDNNKWWPTEYRVCCNALSWGGSALAALMMDARDLWNHDAFFDYQDRYMEVENSAYRQWGNIAGPMWDAYRNDYGCVWTRDDTSDIYSNGHFNCSDQPVRCQWQNSAVGKLVTSCPQYPNQDACDHDPCNLDCDGNCSLEPSPPSPPPSGGNSSFYEDFEQTTNVSQKTKPDGLSFEFVNRSAEIGYMTHWGYTGKFLQIRGCDLSDPGCTDSVIVTNEGRGEWSNYTLKLIAGQKYTRCGIIVNYRNPLNYYLIDLRNNKLIRLSGGASQEISGTGGSIAMEWGGGNNNFTVSMVANNSVYIRVVKDGNNVRTFTDPAPTARNGSIGFFVEKGAGSGNYFIADNINLSL